MEITVDLVLPSLENLGTRTSIVKEGFEMIVVHILKTQYANHNILLNIGDRFSVLDLEDTVCPLRLIVSARIFNLSFANEKGQRVHFIMEELE